MCSTSNIFHHHFNSAATNLPHYSLSTSSHLFNPTLSQAARSCRTLHALVNVPARWNVMFLHTCHSSLVNIRSSFHTPKERVSRPRERPYCVHVGDCIPVRVCLCWYQPKQQVSAASQSTPTLGSGLIIWLGHA